ncbi:hypothetical protein CU102_11705 [Phyllobacterium brassicacearum]|uniref:DUF3592 domain-containing protein n=1 Tax=Phyllobacterium brassicacearum TaxID=314235 RepID=A0A2P7BR49_9HYPH|nr:DUF3592 domain-containing protein [Phyllobacterium brassicacearum]PSH68925.1 hypothetical protein CU102_11705 [Phyllobacterium brassicacearum]TDQ33672.1 uncharacterized protein DUF3592 [Phyllobacterium brassicacearum]
MLDLVTAYSAIYAWLAEDLRLVRLLFLVVGIGLASNTIWRLWRDAVLRRLGKSTEGRIVRVSTGDSYDTAIIRYTDGEGRTHQFDSELPHAVEPIGAIVEVRYDPRNPHRAHVAGRPLGRILLYASTLIVAAGFVFLSMVLSH